MDCLSRLGGGRRRTVRVGGIACTACTVTLCVLSYLYATGTNTHLPHRKLLGQPDDSEPHLNQGNIHQFRTETISVIQDKLKASRNHLKNIKERVARVREQCALMGKPKRDVALNPPDSLIVNEEHRIIYCNVPKVGCTNWKTIFLNLGGFDILNTSAVERLGANAKGRIYLDYIHKYTNISKRRYMLKNYKKFMFVRHPFTRILSAFRNKLAPNTSFYFRFQDEKLRWVSTYGKEIIEKYRGQAEAKRVSANYNAEYDLTFAEFVRFLVDPETDSYNKHWSEIHEMCLPCDLDYDVIGKYETLHEDAEYILRLAEVDPSVHFPTPSPLIVTNSSDPKMAEEYYRHIPKATMYQLIELYLKDFELFGYHPDPFMNLQ